MYRERCSIAWRPLMVWWADAPSTSFFLTTFSLRLFLRPTEVVPGAVHALRGGFRNRALGIYKRSPHRKSWEGRPARKIWTPILGGEGRTCSKRRANAPTQSAPSNDGARWGPLLLSPTIEIPPGRVFEALKIPHGCPRPTDA